MSEELRETLDRVAHDIEKLDNIADTKENNGSSENKHITLNYFKNLVTNMEGDFISSDGAKYEANDGNVNIGGVFKSEQEQLVVELVTEYEIEFIKSVYVHHGNYQALLDTIAGRTLTIIYSDKGLGKYSSALYALDYIGFKQIYHIKPNSFDFNKLKSYPFGNGKGYIFDNVVPDGNSLTLEFLKNLEESLKNKSIKVIIIVDKDSYSALNDHFGSYCLRLQPIESPRIMLENHIKYFTKNAQKNHSVINDKHKSNQLSNIASKVKCDVLQSSPHKVRNISKIIIEGIIENQEEVSILKTIEEFVNGIQQNYEQINDIEERLFYVTLACFNNCPYNIILDAYNSLKEHLQENLSESDKQALINNVYINTPRSKRLERLNAKLITRLEAREYSQKENIEYLSFIYPNYAEGLVEYIWNEYEHWRTPLMKWLFQMVALDKRGNYSEGVSKTISFIAKHDFSEVINCIKIHCCRQNSNVLLRFGALILYKCCEFGDIQSKSLQLVHHWATLVNSDLNTIAMYTYSLLSSHVDDCEMILNDIGTVCDNVRLYKDSDSLVRSLLLCFSGLLKVSEDKQNIFAQTIEFFDSNTTNGDYRSEVLKFIFLTQFGFSFSKYRNFKYPSILLGFKIRMDLRSTIISIFKRLLNNTAFDDLTLEVIHDIVVFSGCDNNTYILSETLLLFLARDLNLFQKNKLLSLLNRMIWKKEEGHVPAQNILTAMKNNKLISG